MACVFIYFSFRKPHKCAICVGELTVSGLGARLLGLNSGRPPISRGTLGKSFCLCASVFSSIK